MIICYTIFKKLKFPAFVSISAVKTSPDSAFRKSPDGALQKSPDGAFQKSPDGTTYEKPFHNTFNSDIFQTKSRWRFPKSGIYEKPCHKIA